MKWITSVPLVAILTLTGALTGCGLGETAATAATGATSEAQQAKQAKATEQEVRQKVQAALREDAQKRAAAEKQGE